MKHIGELTYAAQDGYAAAALCRIHHTEKHKIGVINFKNKYQIKGIKLNQKTIKKLNIGNCQVSADEVIMRLYQPT
ncbi:hypothetical protein EfmAA96_07920 [Enterococcus faecium]|nr:hypothetical protein EfmAA96_07920 [Enterococcus faecium]